MRRDEERWLLEELAEVVPGLKPEHLVRLLAKRREKRDRKLAAFLGVGDPELGASWAARRSDVTLYLNEAAETRDRWSRLADEVLGVCAALDESGRWEQAGEWRIGTYGTVAIERRGDAFVTTADHHGIFEAVLPTLPPAIEAARLLPRIQQHLFYAVGWASWAGYGQLDAADAGPERTHSDDAEPYLVRLSREALADECRHERALKREGGWTAADGGPVARRISQAGDVYRVEVERAGLRFTVESPTAHRALQFAGICARLAVDIAHVLRWWEPPPAQE